MKLQVLLLGNYEFQLHFPFRKKAEILSENAVEIGILNEISRRDSPKKFVNKQESLMFHDVIFLSKKKSHSISNRFNSHVCQFNAFTFKKESLNV